MKPEQIKQWLKDQGQSRDWLARQCNVSKSTVDGWMAGRSIPKPTQSILAGLIYNNKPLAPKFTMEQFAQIQQRAKKEGLSVESWIEKAVLGALLIVAGIFLAYHHCRSSRWTPDALAKSATAGLSALASLR